MKQVRMRKKMAPGMCHLKKLVRKTSAIAVAGFIGLASVGAHAAGDYFVPEKGRVSAPPGAQALCQTYRWACSASSEKRHPSRSELRLIQQINAYVNRTVRPVEDAKQYGVVERWAMPTRRGGDCEDYALAKKLELIRRGVTPQRLLLATVLDRKRNAHAVLVYRSDQGDLVLDNLTNRIKNWRDTRYVFLRMQDPKNPRGWVNVLSGG